MKMCTKSYSIDFLAFILFIFASGRGLEAKKPGRIAPCLITSTNEAEWKLDSIMRFVLKGEHLCLGCWIDGSNYIVPAIPNEGDGEPLIISAPHDCWEKAIWDMKHLEIKTARGENVHFETDHDTGVLLFDTNILKPASLSTSALSVGTEGVVATWDNGTVVQRHFVITSNRKCPIIEEEEAQDFMFCAEYFDSHICKIDVGYGGTFFINRDGAQLAAGIQTVYNEATGGNAFYYSKAAYDALNEEEQID